MATDYKWSVGDVFTDGKHHWAVDSVSGEKAVLRSCGSSWATTVPLTFTEWREGGRWQRCEQLPGDFEGRGEGGEGLR